MREQLMWEELADDHVSSYSTPTRSIVKMILTTAFLLRELRWIPPSVFILGSSIPFLSEWTIIRTLTLPLPDRVYRRLEEKLYGSYQATVGFFYEVWSGVEFCFYGDRIPNEPENVLYLSNHQCSVDWVLPEVLCVKQGGYGGRAKYILKDALKFIPLYGWYLGMRGGIFVKRGKDRDQSAVVRGLRSFVEKDMPVWLVIFPEGTRYDVRDKHSLKRAKSQEFARSVGLPELEHVLTPRTTGFELALEHIRDHFSAVYDLTILYEGFNCRREDGGLVRIPPPDLFGFFSGQCAKVHIHVRRIPIEEVPHTPEEQRTWMYDAYSRKENLIATMLQTGSFNVQQYSHPLPLSQYALPFLVICAPILLGLTHRYGRIWIVGTFLFYTAVTFISGLRSNLTRSR